MENADLKLLRLFLTVVEAGGLSAAQDELNLSLSTISGRISELEARFGMKLCQRGRAGFALTEEGKSLYDECRRLFGTLENFDRRVRSLRSSMTGRLRIGLTDNTLSDPNSKLEKVFSRFCSAAPDVEISIMTRPPNELLRDVVAGQLDLAIASFPRLALGLSYQELYTEAQAFYCGADHPLFLRDDREIDVAEVRTHRIVARSYWGARDLKLFGVGSAQATVSDMEAEARLILSGQFLGYLPKHLAASFVAAGRMRALRSELFGYKARFEVAYYAASARRPVIAAMLKAILTELRDKGKPAP